MPFGIDMWVAEKRAEATEYVAKLGLQDKFLYNSITPWDKDVKGQVKKLKDLGIKHVVVQAFDDQDQTPGGRLKSLEKLLEQGAGDFETVIVDTSVMNMRNVVLPRRLLQTGSSRRSTGFPAAARYSNGTHMWKEAKPYEPRRVQGHGRSCPGHASVIWSDFNFYGPIVTAPRIFPAVAAGPYPALDAALRRRRSDPDNPDLPIKKYFGEFLGKLTAGAARK